MGIMSYKPTSPSKRSMTVDTFEDITKTTPEKSLTKVYGQGAGVSAYVQ